MRNVPYIGQMDRLVTLYKKEMQVTELSAHKETLVQVAKPWAHMQDKSGTQTVEGAVTTVVNRTYTIRRNAEIVANGWKMVLQDGLVKYEVYNVAEIGRSHLELTVRTYE